MDRYLGVTPEVWQQLLSVEPILQFFSDAHLPPLLAEISRPFGLLAEVLIYDLPRNLERSEALHKLLEAKEAAIRARMYINPKSMATRN